MMDRNNQKKKNEQKQIYNVETDKLIMRDHLAADRTALANERTFLAYIRTALAFIAAGFGLIKLLETSTAFVVVGWILVGLGIIIGIFGTIRFIQFRKNISVLSRIYDVDEHMEELEVQYSEEEDEEKNSES